MSTHANKGTLRIIVVAAVMVLLLAWAQGDLRFIGIGPWDAYFVRILNLAAINTILALSLNLVNGFTGQFSLGHAGFMAVGAYTTSLLVMTPQMKKVVFFMEPMFEPLDRICIPFLPALLVGGVVSCVFGILVGIPALRLKGDYLAIATLGFAEIIRLILQNVRRLTNGALGLKGIPQVVNLWWTFGAGVAVFLFIRGFVRSSFGRALIAIRDNETAAELMGIDVFKHKLLAFAISSFVTGIGGGLMASLLTTIDPAMFKFPLTFQILLTVVLGGMGSLSGSVIAAFIVTFMTEFLRVVDEPLQLGAYTIHVPGLRMVIFSALLVIVVVFYPRGLMGNKELTWESLSSPVSRLLRRRVAS
ncbi:MAG: branched-chain amino acid ABC transporter permease [Firmicutes bacterium]|nr:branched-chain amino acid ABC transporter permease [Candidatus Fermentithermobacillaceae bacterium]